ncbi:hypothetical protein BY458DRAFT_558317 [Sporodiniella umbellata]|nr:hypothetical protein BY458DRAFT_558317 [Sporodiniella umbellata]
MNVTKSSYQTCSLPVLDFSLDSFSAEILSQFEKKDKHLYFKEEDMVETDTLGESLVQEDPICKSSGFTEMSSSTEGGVAQVIDKEYSHTSMLRKSSTFFKNKLRNKRSSSDSKLLFGIKRSNITLEYASAPDLCTKNSTLRDSTMSSSANVNIVAKWGIVNFL